MAPEAGRRKNRPKLSLQAVQPDATVELKFEGVSKTVMSVEASADYRRLNAEVREPDHEGVIIMGGKKKKIDTFTLADGRQVVVGGIHHKYIARSIASFPSAKGASRQRMISCRHFDRATAGYGNDARPLASVRLERSTLMTCKM